jgi:hypothetical protein
VSRLRATDDSVGDRLPDDPSIDALDREVRGILGRQWTLRARSELQVASIFSVVARGLFETGADPAVIGIAARAVSDEVRHAELCRRLAERYLGEEVAWPAAGPVPMPGLKGAPDELRPTLHVLAMGCVNETIASAWLEASLKDAVSPLVRAALRELIADDIHHARLGWAHLASRFVSRERRLELGAWLPGLLEAAALPWTRTREDTDEGFPREGVPSRRATLDIVKKTVRGVILPGFDALGVPVSRADEWTKRQLDDL